MQIRLGYEFIYQCMQRTPMILTINVHESRTADLLTSDFPQTDPQVPVSQYRDGFGNTCTRLVAPPGRIRISADAIIHDSGMTEPVVWNAEQHAVEFLPDDTLVYLLQSRYCESEMLSEIAWQQFGNTQPGWPRVQAICDFVNRHITFGYEYARSSKTAWEVYNERSGVCRDFAHLGIAFCRAMNIPARYCTVYLGDIGVPKVHAPMDFAGCMEVFLGGRWYFFDPRNNAPRIGRVLIARGRDAADVAITTTYGSHVLETFRVWTDEIVTTPMAA